MANLIFVFKNITLSMYLVWRSQQYTVFCVQHFNTLPIPFKTALPIGPIFLVFKF